MASAHAPPHSLTHTIVGTQVLAFIGIGFDDDALILALAAIGLALGYEPYKATKAWANADADLFFESRRSCEQPRAIQRVCDKQAPPMVVGDLKYNGELESTWAAMLER